MRLHLLTYADELYAPMQRKLVEHAASLGIFDSIKSQSREYLIQTDFYKENKYILDGKRGGWCCWKPYYILETLKEMDEGDVLLYMDSADWIDSMPLEKEGKYSYFSYMRTEIFEKMLDNDILLTAGAFPNKQYTKRDVFVYMSADEPKYWDAIQLEAGVILIKNTQWSRDFIAEWLKYCCVSALITNDPNICNLPNLPEFVDIRYDQSILSILQIKHEITPSDFIRKFITCNVNNPA